ncbi:hypothetical protein DFH08DRAFT_1000839 [Mycena albidolilacea]|uniref:Saccharopine dehydrogenase-like C-terminal domain-containing protein n=1 Tax=Mycena albidolilacea TaxID=1033008 RepID=A0AAD7EQS6_9AGAR|nr:hypothetical protein DFH08DRAFT_1000839 [Mycena albidolilacea]
MAPDGLHRYIGYQASPLVLDVATADPTALEVAHNLIFSLVPYTHHAARRWNKPELDPLVRVLMADDFTIPTRTSTHAFCPKSASSAHQTSRRTPDCADNPLRYKFSWSPRGGLLGLLNSVSFLVNGAVTHVAGADLMVSAQLRAIALFVPLLEESPNRNSVLFRVFYRILEAHPVVRGMLQYVGFTASMAVLGKTAWLAADVKEWAGVAHLPVPGDITGLDRVLKQREDSDTS